ncbi:AAA family ATPase [Streptomyces sp. NPDC056713]|uniref:AAA family ATPase n=1 Tax=Streptomyces sp. NPDC056713 TaxID=3345921 RepID=UPI0036A623D5
MTSGETMFPRYTLAPAQLSGDVLGWQLHRDGRFLDCHETFLDGFDRDLEAAMDWADQITGTRQSWRHTRAGGPDRWTAHGPQDDGNARTATGTDAVRGLEPGTPLASLARAQFDLAGHVFGWQLNHGGLLDCHETFAADFDRDVEAAMDWADQIIGVRQDWRHTHADGPERWTAVHSPQEDDGPTSADADLMRSIQPGTLLVAVGVAASGKSTFAAAVADVATVVCLDALREEISGDAGDQSATPAAVERQNLLLEQHLAAGTSVFLDSTNVDPGVRAQLVERARRHGRPIVAVRFLVHLDTCRARNRARPANRLVPDDVLAWQHARTREATPQALLAEGFTAAHDVAINLP